STTATNTTTTTTTPTPTGPSASFSKERPFKPKKSEDWTIYRDIIQNLYRNDHLKLRDVKRYMEENHHFQASEKQYKDRLAAWNVRKNIKAKEVHIMLRKQQRRAAEGKRTAFRVAGQVVEPKRISRFVRRYGNHWELDHAREGISPNTIIPTVETQPVMPQTQQELHQNLPTSPEPETPTDIEYYTPEPDEKAMTLSPMTETPSRFYDEKMEPLPDPEVDHQAPLPVSPTPTAPPTALPTAPPKPIANDDYWKALDVFQGQLLTLSRTLDQSMSKFTSPHD
ncbi:Clr5 domain-containing protein, partial [Aspergillus saccharolyticus JOP 1030-1]